MLENIASDLVPHLQYFLLKRLKEKGVVVLTSSKVVELGKGYAVVEDASGTKRLNGFDNIVLAMGGEVPNDSLYRDLEGKIPELYVIGDAVQPREILEAVSEGEEIAVKI